MDKPISLTNSSRESTVGSVPSSPNLNKNPKNNSEQADLRKGQDYSYNQDENSYHSDGNTPRAKNDSLTVNFDTDDIQKFVSDRSIKVLWERSYLCPCRNPKTGKPDVNCHICGGTGRAYLPARRIGMMIQSQNRKDEQGQAGVSETGDALGTVNMETPITTRDRITCPDVHIIQAYIFNVTDSILETGIRLPYAVYSFLFVASIKGELKEGKDFKYDTDKRLFYVIDKDLLGKNITMRFDTVLRYIVTNMLKENRYQYSNSSIADGNTRYENLPKLVQLTRERALIGESAMVLENSTDELTELSTQVNDSQQSQTVSTQEDSVEDGGFRLGN